LICGISLNNILDVYSPYSINIKTFNPYY